MKRIRRLKDLVFINKKKSAVKWILPFLCTLDREDKTNTLTFPGNKKKLWNMMVTGITIVVDALGMVPKSSEKKTLEELAIRGGMKPPRLQQC